MHRKQEVRILHAYRDRNNENNFNLVVCDVGNTRRGSIVRQSESSGTHEVFEIGETVQVEQGMIMDTFKITFLEEKGKLLVSKEEYARILQEISRDQEEFVRYAHSRLWLAATSVISQRGAGRQLELPQRVRVRTRRQQ